VLRRPAAPQDSVPAAAQLPFVREIAVDYVRRARVLPNGMVVYLIPALDSRGGPLRKRPQRCLARERTALESRLRGTPAQARRAAERMLRARQRLEHQASRVVPPRPGLFVEQGGRVRRGWRRGRVDPQARPALDHRGAWSRFPPHQPGSGRHRHDRLHLRPWARPRAGVHARLSPGVPPVRGRGAQHRRADRAALAARRLLQPPGLARCRRLRCQRRAGAYGTMRCRSPNSCQR